MAQPHGPVRRVLRARSVEIARHCRINNPLTGRFGFRRQPRRCRLRTQPPSDVVRSAIAGGVLRRRLTRLFVLERQRVENQDVFGTGLLRDERLDFVRLHSFDAVIV